MNRFGNPDRNRAVAVWLFATAAIVFLMVVVGGITRLTGSGLSITEWKPIMGAIPPLNDAPVERGVRQVQGRFPSTPRSTPG